MRDTNLLTPDRELAIDQSNDGTEVKLGGLMSFSCVPNRIIVRGYL